MTYNPFDGMFQLFSFLFPLAFFLLFGAILVAFIGTMVKGARQYKANNAAPVLTVEAQVVTKRADVSHHHHTNQNGFTHHTSSTDYFVTFQVASGDRLEFEVPAGEYGMLVEGDARQLTFQGTRYQGFERRGVP